jgi:hypothetical protein
MVPQAPLVMAASLRDGRNVFFRKCLGIYIVFMFGRILTSANCIATLVIAFFPQAAFFSARLKHPNPRRFPILCQTIIHSSDSPFEWIYLESSREKAFSTKGGQRAGITSVEIAEIPGGVKTFRAWIRRNNKSYSGHAGNSNVLKAGKYSG